MNICICIYTCMYVCMCVCMHACMHVCMYAYITWCSMLLPYTHIPLCLYLHMRIHIFGIYTGFNLHICMCIYIERERKIEFATRNNQKANNKLDYFEEPIYAD